jgi:uncharacterized beta-barrel protein YwiB (DUF1934 family)
VTDTKRVPLRWERREFEASGCVQQNVDCVEGATWTVKQGRHYLRYEEAEGGTFTTLCVDGQEMTLVRHGEVTWNCAFRPGQETTSTMHAHGLVFGVRVQTKSFEAEVNQEGGRLAVSYRLWLDGDFQEVGQEVEVVVTFGNLVGPSA